MTEKLVCGDVLRGNTEDVDADRSSNPSVVLSAEERQTLEQWARRPRLIRPAPGTPDIASTAVSDCVQGARAGDVLELTGRAR